VRVYFDYNATTPLAPEVIDAVARATSETFGNPSSVHHFGQQAKAALDDARSAVATLIHADPSEIVFTSGGTEADNLAIRGVAAARPGPVVISAVEHHAVLHPAEALDARAVGVDARGVVQPDELAALLAVTPGVTLVSIMAANNEVGVIQPLAELAPVVRRHAPGAALHTDAVQAAAWLDLATAAATVDLISVSAHKFGGPQGVGALVVRRGTPIRAQLLGGGQERELRSGTHNVAGIVGLAAALAAKTAQREAEAQRVAALRDQLAAGLTGLIPDAWETAAPDGRRAHLLPSTLHLTIAGVESEALLFLLDEAGVCASAASACASGAQEASHVLAAMGVPRAATAGALRLSLGWSSTAADVDRVLDVLPAAVARLRSAVGVGR
jgi:cysteine desulfurase